MINVIKNKRSGEKIPLLCNFDKKNAEDVKNIHSLIPGYDVTPLHSLDSMAKKLGVGKIFVKDESHRFGLNAFKGLGAGYAVIKLMAEKYGFSDGEYSLVRLREAASRDNITLTTATDGNHGKAVAFIARILGMKSVIYMPKGSSKERYDAIKEQGAEVYITEENYDGSVRIAMKNAEEKGYIFVQDTAMEGYTHIPLYIMQGYMNIIHEAYSQLGGTVPTHVFLQAGVGSFAGSILAYMVNMYENYPVTVILEPQNANCVYMSAKEGHSFEVTGDLETIMAGLSCGVASSLALEILLGYADMFVSLSDDFAKVGMRKLYHAEGNDPKIISGESGAVGMGFLHEVMLTEEYSSLRESLGLGKDSVVLLISTEGDTDKESYCNIVFDNL